MKIRSLLISLLFFTTVAVNATENLSNAEAMYIYNFLRHVEWPANSTGEKFVIGVYGNSQTFNQLVNFTKNRKVGSRSIEVIKISSVEEAAKCQLIFVPNSYSLKIATISKALGSRPTLIVGEKEGSNSMGANIEFVIQDDKLKFRIDETKTKTKNLSVSRALIDMAI